MTDEEFEELKTKFTKELERRKRLESALGDIEHVKNCKKDNPSIRVRNRTIVLTEEKKALENNETINGLRVFNVILRKISESFKNCEKLYVIAFYNMYNFQSITGDISDSYEEIKKIYDEKYAWKPNQIGVTEYHYEIVEISMKEVKNETLKPKNKELN